jgi:hypothetical protein
VVPLGRYFIWVGSVLLAMIFVAGWLWPSAAPAPVNEVVAAQAPTDPANSMMLRIQSARKWPDKIVFDTSIPTIVPPAPPVVAAIAPPAATSAPAASPRCACRIETGRAAGFASAKAGGQSPPQECQARRLDLGLRQPGGTALVVVVKFTFSALVVELVTPAPALTCPQAWPGN